MTQLLDDIKHLLHENREKLQDAIVEQIKASIEWPNLEFENKWALKKETILKLATLLKELFKIVDEVEEQTKDDKRDEVKDDKKDNNVLPPAPSPPSPSPSGNSSGGSSSSSSYTPPPPPSPPRVPITPPVEPEKDSGSTLKPLWSLLLTCALILI